MSTPTYDVVTRRIFPAPVDRVWRAWSDGDQVRRWWGPEGFTCPRAEVDLRVGGRTLVAMQAPAEMGGVLLHSTWTFSEVVPLERIVYTFRFTDGDGRPLRPGDLGLPAGVPEAGVHVVTFEQAPGDACVMTVVEHGYTTPEARDVSAAGLDQCLDKMARAVSPAGSS